MRSLFATTRKSDQFVRSLTLAFALIGAVLFPLRALTAPTFTVNSVVDAVASGPLDNGVCETAPGNGICTLRAAVMKANHYPGGGVTIVLSAAVYALTIPPSGTDDESSGDLNITASMTIIGAGAAITIIDANKIDRAINAAGSAMLTISNLTIRNGLASGFGGGILNKGALNVNNAIITANQSGTGSAGGGIINLGPGIMVLNDTSVIGNRGGGNAGGIYNDNTASLTINNGIVTANQTLEGGYGGGIANDGMLTLNGCLIANNQTSPQSGNAVAGYGGGIANFSGVATLVNSTLSNNGAYGNGGGIYNGGGTVNAYFVTVAGNLAESYATGTGTGGGIYNSAGTVSLRTTLIGQNYAGTALNDITGTIASQDYNLIQTTAGATITGATSHNIVGLDPLLESLQNSGSSQTRALFQGSPAIDAVPLAQCTDQFGAPLTVDQAGSPRPIGGACDIGACEGARSSSLYNRNLIRNGDADSAAGSPAGAFIAVPYWVTTSGKPTAVPYNAAGGFPNLATDAVPTNHGSSFFAGGNGGTGSSAIQQIDVSALQAEIDASKITFTLSGDLGGYAGQNDEAQLMASFLLANGNLISSATIGPVSASDRGGVTGFRNRSLTGTVPIGTRQIRFTLSMLLANGPYNDGYADNLSFMLLPPSLRITSITRGSGVSSGHFLIDGTFLPNAKVTVQAAPDLLTPFTPLGTAAADNIGVFHYDDASAVSPVQMRVYRVTYP